ncbi:unnamed protein product [Ranitomeya imitator]|uniref:Uncharacterized protein n=1 Tax=Ranitomeya imitator TaxID=111125 RepID=A0ABN9MKH3_9NEOB|nr:unnamed protein product [Ranitomeya imitator]
MTTEASYSLAKLNRENNPFPRMSEYLTSLYSDGVKGGNLSPASHPRILPPEKRPPDPPGPPPPPPIPEGDAADENPVVTTAQIQQLTPSEVDPDPVKGVREGHRLPSDLSRKLSSRTCSSEGPEDVYNVGSDDRDSGQALGDCSPQSVAKSRTFPAQLEDTSGYQGTGSLQFPGDQDLRFTRVPLGMHSGTVPPTGQIEEISNSSHIYQEAKISNYSELGSETAVAGFQQGIQSTNPCNSERRPGKRSPLLKFSDFAMKPPSFQSASHKAVERA